MSNEQTQESELKELEQQIEQVAEAQQTQAATEEPTPSPEPVSSPAPLAETTQEAPVAPEPSAKPSKDPLKWAYEEKGYKSPEDMARELLRREQAYHEEQQRKEKGTTLPPPPAWNPQPQQGYPQPNGYGYPSPRPSREEVTRKLAEKHGMDPDDVSRIAPLVFELADGVASQRTMGIERELLEVRRQSSRQDELMRLMQDPRFRHEAVQREIHAVLDADPTIFQRERNPHVYAFKEALANLGSKTLQQGVGNGNTPPTNMPPVTAGGGNGSASAGLKISPRDFERWPIKDQEAFINSGGRIVPKR